MKTTEREFRNTYRRLLQLLGLFGNGIDSLRRYTVALTMAVGKEATSALRIKLSFKIPS